MLRRSKTLTCGVNPADLCILHSDAALIVIEKPAGLPAVPGRPVALHDCVASRVQARWPDALVVHRLDMATSGLMLMARGAAAQRALSHAFAQRQIEKTYLAIVAGLLATAPGQWQEIEAPIGTDWPNRPRRIIDPEQGKNAHTHYRLISHQTAQQTSRVELKPVTGRTHQLRLHLQHLGHPILGDTLYAPAAIQTAAKRLLLHASQLALSHPADGRPMVFNSAAPF